MDIYINRMAGGFPFEISLNARVDGSSLDDALDSLIEYISDHAEEVLVPVGLTDLDAGVYNAAADQGKEQSHEPHIPV